MSYLLYIFHLHFGTLWFIISQQFKYGSLVKWSRRRPLKAESRVQFSYELRKKAFISQVLMNAFLVSII